MVIVQCLHSACIFITGNVADALAAMLLQIHPSRFHSGGTPDVGQNNATPIAVVAHAKKV